MLFSYCLSPYPQVFFLGFLSLPHLRYFTPLVSSQETPQYVQDEELVERMRGDMDGDTPQNHHV